MRVPTSGSDTTLRRRERRPVDGSTPFQYSSHWSMLQRGPASCVSTSIVPTSRSWPTSSAMRSTLKGEPSPERGTSSPSVPTSSPAGTRTGVCKPPPLPQSSVKEDALSRFGSLTSTAVRRSTMACFEASMPFFAFAPQPRLRFRAEASAFAAPAFPSSSSESSISKLLSLSSPPPSPTRSAKLVAAVARRPRPSAILSLSVL
mmetsp:Transcript_14447/g.47434  ORF Transcript_14447/g.47434 Transcript_14447/m.47434 type:complete len:203 (+) Transcript_14447:2796-3404(+)